MPSRYAVTQSHLVRGLGKLAAPSWTPPITKGLRLNKPMRLNGNAIWNNGAPGVQASSNESVDAVGSYDHARTRLITPAQVNVLRIEKDGGVVEGERTNKILQARQYGTTWTKIAGLTIAQDAIGVDGVANAAWTLTDDSSSAEHLRQNVSIPNDSTTWTTSFGVRKDSITDRFPGFHVNLFGGTPRDALYRVNTATGETFEEISNGTTSVIVEDAGDYWRLIISVANNSSGNVTMQLNIYVARSATLTGVVDGATQGSFVLDAVQFENAPFASLFIDTTSAAVIRASEDLRHATAGNLLAAVGTVIFVHTPLWDASTQTTDYYLLDCRTADLKNGFFIFWDDSENNISAIIRSGGATTARIDAPDGITKNTPTVLTLSWGLNDFKIYKDGVLGETDSAGSAPASVSASLYLGQREDGLFVPFGNYAHLLIYNRILSAIEIMILTSTIRTWMGVR